MNSGRNLGKQTQSHMQSLKSMRAPDSEVPEFDNLARSKKGGSSMMNRGMNRGSSHNVRAANLS